MVDEACNVQQNISVLYRIVSRYFSVITSYPLFSLGGENLFILPLEIGSNYMHTFIGHFSGTTLVSRYQKGKANLDFTVGRDCEWQWQHQLGHMLVCTLLQTDNHDSTPPVTFLQAGCPSCHPTNSIKALKAYALWQ